MTGPRDRVMLLIALILAIGVRVPSVSTASVLLDRIVVVVNGQPVTQSKVDLFRDYLVLTHGTGLGWPRDLGSPTTITPEKMVDIVVLDELLFDAASQVNVVRVSDRDLERRIEVFQGRFPDEQAYRRFLAAHGLTEEYEREFFSRRLRVEGYIRFKLGYETPDESHLKAFQEAHARRYGGARFEEVRDRVAWDYFVAQCRVDFDRWTDELKKRAVIVVPSREITR